MSGRAVLCAALLLLPHAARAEGQGVFAQSCVQGYALSFAQVQAAANGLKLKLENAQAEVARSFKERPSRCEAGAYDYYLDQLMSFVKRALRSGATPQSPKDGWVRAAAAIMDFSPQRVPRAEYYADMQRFQATRQELLALIAEAGAGPLPSALAVAFERAAPIPGAYGPPAAPLPQEAQSAPPPPEQQPVSAPAPTYVPAAAQPVHAPPQPAAAPTPSGVPSYIHFPRVPLPDWAAINLHEVRDLLSSGREAQAREKLDQVLRWIEQR